MSDLDVLQTLRHQIVPPPLDSLRETARRRTRRGTVLGAVVAAAAVVVVAATAVVVAGDDADRSPLPVQPPEQAPSSRPLTYADGAVVHYGDQTVEAAGSVVELDVTDHGVAFRTADGRIWFTDGSTVDELGALGEPGPTYDGGDIWPLLVHDGWLVSGHTGSRVAWFEFPQEGEPVAVVYDSAAHEVLIREPVAAGPAGIALPYLVSDRYFYWFADAGSELEAADTPQVRLDPGTGDQLVVSPQEVQDDLRSQGKSRTILIGDAEEGGQVRITDGTDRNFSSRGGRITPQGAQPLLAVDGATGKRLEFEAPPGYPGNILIWLTQWLDDDTVVLVSQVRKRDEVLECQVGSGACAVVVSGESSLVFPEIG